MIGQLFELHNIDYVISVDDCYSINDDIEFARSSIFSKWITDINSSNISCIDSIMAELGKIEIWNDYKTIISFGSDNSNILSNFISMLEEKDVLEIFRKLNLQYENSAYLEKNRLLIFLNKLKEEGYIKGYYTYSSTQSALNDYSKLERSCTGMLWLIDKNFSSVGEAPDAGLSLAKNIIEGNNGIVPSYVFILSSLDDDSNQTEDDIEREFDKKMQDSCSPKTASFIYYLFKQRINPDKMERISKGLAQGFKRKVCYQLFEDYINCIKKGADETEKNLHMIKQDTLNYLFSERVSEDGESIWEFLVRFVDLMMQDEYRKALAENYAELAKKIMYYKNISQIATSRAANKNTESEIVVQYRKKEMYDFCVNKLHLEVTTGDIFRINDEYYILISQACDSCLRADGKRTLKNATLLQIKNNLHGVALFKYDLKVPLLDELDSPTIDFKHVLSIPFDLLDLCVLNNDGYASLLLGKDINELLGFDSLFEDRFKKRMNYVNQHLNNIISNNRLLENHFKEAQICPLDKVLEAYNFIKTVAPELLHYNEKSNPEPAACYNIQRICRLQELTAIDIVRKYGNNVSRIGHSFDFAQISAKK